MYVDLSVWLVHDMASNIIRDPSKEPWAFISVRRMINNHLCFARYKLFNYFVKFNKIGLHLFFWDSTECAKPTCTPHIVHTIITTCQYKHPYESRASSSSLAVCWFRGHNMISMSVHGLAVSTIMGDETFDDTTNKAFLPLLTTDLNESNLVSHILSSSPPIVHKGGRTRFLVTTSILSPIQPPTFPVYTLDGYVAIIMLCIYIPLAWVHSKHAWVHSMSRSQTL